LVARRQDDHKEINMTLQMFKLLGGCALSASLLAACGGGGGDSGPTPPAPSTSTFPLNAGYKALIVSGSTHDFDLSLGCLGTATIKDDPAVATTFEGVAGFSVTETFTTNFTAKCQSVKPTVVGSLYYNANYVPIGLSKVGGDYSKFDAPPSDLPAAAKVGDSGTLVTMSIYANNTKTPPPTGKSVVSYEIKADTATTAIANIITSLSDTATPPKLLVTETKSYRIAESGALTLLSIDILSTAGAGLHYVYTPK
jgi:hypothetical protein